MEVWKVNSTYIIYEYNTNFMKQKDISYIQLQNGKGVKIVSFPDSLVAMLWEHVIQF